MGKLKPQLTCSNVSEYIKREKRAVKRCSDYLK